MAEGSVGISKVPNSTNILVGCTGSVASVKVPQLTSKLLSSHPRCGERVNVCLVATERARHFFCEAELAKDVKLVTDDVEWDSWRTLGDPVLHVDLRRWADLMVIAPIDANTLGKIASGICDNLLTCVVRAWDRQKPLLFCPAMNTFMWEHPVTCRNVEVLKDFGYYEVPCVAKHLACNDVGMGAMAEVDDIIKSVWLRLNIA